LSGRGTRRRTNEPAARLSSEGKVVMTETAKVTLVTVVSVFEIEERLVKDLRALGVHGYTMGKVDGFGLHGRRMAGLVDAPNMRLEMLVTPALAQRILDRIVSKYEGQPVMAYIHEVHAVPHEHFE
jgi:nitrogen regulatory protein PII